MTDMHAGLRDWDHPPYHPEHTQIFFTYYIQRFLKAQERALGPERIQERTQICLAALDRYHQNGNLDALLQNFFEFADLDIRQRRVILLFYGLQIRDTHFSGDGHHYTLTEISERKRIAYGEVEKRMRRALEKIYASQTFLHLEQLLKSS